MYQPEHFRVEDRDKLLPVIGENPLAQLITAGEGGLIANPIPFTIAYDGETLLLRAHLARANPQWKELAAGAPALVVFQSVERYISPGWYATKRETGKVVPTWNYVVVQARGPVTVDESPEWLRRQVEALTEQEEGRIGADWKVDDAPESYMRVMMRGIVGIEMRVESLIGKFKASQNRPEADRVGVAEGLSGQQAAPAAAMADLVRSLGPGT
jgi:transcriptional regulator